MRVGIVGSYGRSLVNFRGPLIAELRRRGHDVVALSPDIDDSTEIELRRLGAICSRYHLSRRGVNPLSEAFTLLSLVREFRRHSFDCVLLYTAKPVVYGSFAAKIVGVRCVVSMITGLGYAYTATSLAARTLQAVQSALYRLALGFNRLVVFQNLDDLKEFELRSILPPCVRVGLTNGSGVDTNYFSVMPTRNGQVFLMIARLIREKGVSCYVDAAHVVKRTWPNARFLLAGPLEEGPSAISSEDIARWQRDGTVEYLGELSDVRVAFEEASVFVLPSLREGRPRTVLEAMACGRPVIVYDVPGCRQTVSNGVNGLVVERLGPEALAEAMDFALRHPGELQAMGRRGREMAECLYDSAAVATDLCEQVERSCVSE